MKSAIAPSLHARRTIPASELTRERNLLTGEPSALNEWRSGDPEHRERVAPLILVRATRALHETMRAEVLSNRALQHPRAVSVKHEAGRFSFGEKQIDERFDAFHRFVHTHAANIDRVRLGAHGGRSKSPSQSRLRRRLFDCFVLRSAI